MTSALNHFSSGRAYLTAARLIIRSPEYPPRSGEVILPLHALLSFSIEFYMKGYLSERGVSPQELSGIALRHNLQALLDRAVALGFGPPARLPEVVGILSPEHARHQFRYMPDDHTYITLNYPAVEDVLEQLDAGMRREISAVRDYRGAE